jgi:hypothetical protein
MVPEAFFGVLPLKRKKAVIWNHGKMVCVYVGLPSPFLGDCPGIPRHLTQSAPSQQASGGARKATHPSLLHFIK